MQDEVIFNLDIITKSYPDGEERTEKYLRVLDLKEQGFSLKELSEKLNVNKITAYDWLKRNKKPHAIRAMQLAKKKGWLPISTKSKKFLTILDIFAFIFGDGHLHKDGYIILFGQRLDLEKLAKRIEEDLDLRCTIKEDPGTFKSNNSNTCRLNILEGCRPFGRLLMALGAPVGNKVESDFQIPTWLMVSTLNIKIRFLEILFANEITVRKIGAKGELPNFDLRMDKHPNYVGSLICFMEQIQSILSESNITSTTPKIFHKQNMSGAPRCTVQLTINKRAPNLYRFYKTLELRYASKKQKSLERTGLEIERRLNLHLRNIDNYRLAQDFRRKGLGRRSVAKLLSINSYQVDGWYRRRNKPLYLNNYDEIKSLLNEKYW